MPQAGHRRRRAYRHDVQLRPYLRAGRAGHPAESDGMPFPVWDDSDVDEAAGDRLLAMRPPVPPAGQGQHDTPVPDDFTPLTKYQSWQAGYRAGYERGVAHSAPAPPTELPEAVKQYIADRKAGVYDKPPAGNPVRLWSLHKEDAPPPPDGTVIVTAYREGRAEGYEAGLRRAAQIADHVPDIRDAIEDEMAHPPEDPMADVYCPIPPELLESETNRG